MRNKLCPSLGAFNKIHAKKNCHACHLNAGIKIAMAIAQCFLSGKKKNSSGYFSSPFRIVWSVCVLMTHGLRIIFYLISIALILPRYSQLLLPCDVQEL